MTIGRLMLRSLFFHWRGNSAVLLGVAVGAAVLIGALLVGDSLRGSLYDSALQQLGWIDHVLVGSRFVREDLTNDLPGKWVCSAILIQGSARTSKASVNRVTILGVDERFWHEGEPPVSRDFWRSATNEVVLNAGLAHELNVVENDTITLQIQKATAMPRETVLGRGKADELVDRLDLTVRAVLPNDSPGARFNLSPSPAAPRNAYVPLAVLQAALTSAKRESTLPARPVNAIFVQGGTTEALQAGLREHLTLDDWGLTLLDPEERLRRLDRNRDGKVTRSEWTGRVPRRLADKADKQGVLSRDAVLDFYRKLGYLSLESRQTLLDPAVEKAALAAAADARWPAAATLVYIANRISGGGREVPYSVVAALDPGLSPPLGPFLPHNVKLAEDEIALIDWIVDAQGIVESAMAALDPTPLASLRPAALFGKKSPVPVWPGQKVTLTYFQPEEQGRVSERTKDFRFHGLIPLQGVADDPDLAPEFPGITDTRSLSEWDPPPPFDRRDIQKRVTKRDEDYWERYRTTPKGYVTLAAGQKIWGSRFGNVTSIRLAPPVGTDLHLAAESFRPVLLKHLRPEDGGFVFDDVRKRNSMASAGGTNFGWLFLGFSVFLIVSALLLVGLLFRLNLDQRATEIGLLRALGYRRSTVLRLLLGEGACLAIVGGLIGSIGAVAYAGLMLRLLTAWWPGALDQSFLRLHTSLDSFLIGYGAALLITLLTIGWTVLAYSRSAPRALLAGQTISDVEKVGPRRLSRWSWWSAGLAAAGAIILVIAGPYVHDQEMRAMTFFSSGGLLLTAGLAVTWAWMRGSQRGSIGGQTLTLLGVRNATRHPVRSLLTAGLLAAATFLVVAVESFHRDPGKDFLDKKGGSGGFNLLAESDVPIIQDLSTVQGRRELDFTDKATTTLQDVSVYAFRLRPGDDASCLNLYEARRPRLLGVPHSLIVRGGFQFQDSQARSLDNPDNPWLLLEKTYPDNEIPVFGEANTVEWMLKSGLGEKLAIPDESGVMRTLRIVGLLKDSVFQGELLLSEANFLRLYPRQEGYRFFLIDAPPKLTAEVKTTLETALQDYGFSVSLTEKRLEAYLQVENTYLLTFQALGGLGLLLGSLGLAVVLVRSIWERRGELALFRALGFRRSALGWLVLAENAFLLALGLSIGTLAALLAVLPHLTGAVQEVAWLKLLGLLALVLTVGFTAGLVAMTVTLRAPLVPALRRE